MKKTDFTSITDITAEELVKLLKNALALKKDVKTMNSALQNKTLVMIFEKPSLRTRLSFEIGMTQLGGHAIYLAPSDIGLGKRESIEDVAKVTSSMGDIIMARTFAHKTVTDLAKYASIPVINGLSDHEHPCQILADFQTILEVKGTLKGLTLSFVGDANNNVVHSLALGSALLGMKLRVAAPKGYLVNKDIVKQTGLFQTEDPAEAIKNADVVITDTWVSMGSESEKEVRINQLKPYQVNSRLMSLAKSDAIFMHCLPAYRGNEVTAEVIDGPQSVVFQEAENRLHAQKALLIYLMNKN